MKSMLLGELFTAFRNWLALGVALCPGSGRPQVSGASECIKWKDMLNPKGDFK